MAADSQLIEITVMLVGNSGVGKSSLTQRYMNEYQNDIPKTAACGLDSKVTVREVAGRRVRLRLLDTSGQERYGPLLDSFYRSSDGYIVVFDLTDNESLLSVDKWVSTIEQHNRRDTTEERLLVGNKADLEHQLTYEEAKLYGETIQMNYYQETSAKEDTNVNEAIESLVIRLLERKGYVIISDNNGFCRSRCTCCCRPQ